ncbi:hypothetical protein [uncultured Shimia sp.]|uniref:hypothetical protein n=1 Tax=uncultured Shimia sp. TaxID=573152 RepID=UPI0026299551|nr:hypothetical protein [uncultured Shimia sp.]
MPPERVSVLREFEMIEQPCTGQETLVFESRTHTEKFGFTRFVREIKNTDRPWTDTVILRDEGQVIGSGEDPRPFIWRGSPCAIATTFSPKHGPIHKIYVQTLNKWILLIPPRSIATGKNWAPFVADDNLFFVHAMSPFRILKARFISEHDDFMVLDVVAEHPMRTPKSSDGFSQFRGGSNALQFGDRILGIGHANQRPDRKDPASMIHRPFVYDYRPGKSVSYYSFDFDFEDTYRIVDPTSLYQKDGITYLVTSETEQVWHLTPQMGRTCLYSLGRIEENHEEGFGIGRRRLHRWSHGQASAIRRFLGARSRHQSP